MEISFIIQTIMSVVAISLSLIALFYTAKKSKLDRIKTCFEIIDVTQKNSCWNDGVNAIAKKQIAGYIIWK